MKVSSYYDPARGVTTITVAIADRWVIDASRASLCWLKVAEWAIQKALSPLPRAEGSEGR